ncbi:cytidylyltransferase domain-containing protein [Algihabitans albus]|uniref:cytidylyltransferase domain-containing protein n=1 Tax=Algihabitans albus TaxID=2164067 RepID=UPI000E5C9140|nr:hypothetical protein [Algihabitans albus]
MTSISVIINARTTSSRLPRKLVRPFAGTSLIDIALEKLDRMGFFAHRYLAVAEPELAERAKPFGNIEILWRDEAAIKPGYNPHEVQYAHYRRIDSEYFVWMNACCPLLSMKTLRSAAEEVARTRHNSYTSVVPTTDWIFDSDGHALTNKDASMVSTAHSPTFYRVAHVFHVFNKSFFERTNELWTLMPDDPALIQVPEEEIFDVNTPLEFEIAEAAYRAQSLSHTAAD